MRVQFPQPAPMELKKVKGDIYFAKGGLGTNIGFYTGNKSILAIDAKMDRESSANAIDEIKKISSNPITHMIITHGDPDHINGLDAFPEGMTIISHQAAKGDMENAFKEPSLSHLNSYLPNRTFTDSMDLDIDGKLIKLINITPAHTSGDALVYFPEENVVFIGDLILLERDPLIHLHKGGSSFGLVKYLRELVKLDADIIIGGHCEFVDKKKIEAIAESISARQGKIGMLIKEGKNLEQVKEILDVREVQSPPGIPRFPSMEEIIYREISRG
jgi:cyclase